MLGPEVQPQVKGAQGSFVSRRIPKAAPGEASQAAAPRETQAPAEAGAEPEPCAEGSWAFPPTVKEAKARKSKRERRAPCTLTLEEERRRASFFAASRSLGMT